MAKLGIALKRDFPQYYPYFETRQFSWDGVTYYTHNRVMLRYAGTDGIKTGYTGAAGFNLVTSVTRGGRPLVGVVMGGVSGAWRDNRMIQLLDGTYQQLAERGGAKGKMFAANLPLAKNGQKVGVGISNAAVLAASNNEMFATKEDATPTGIEEAEDNAPNNNSVGDVSGNETPSVATAQAPANNAVVTATAAQPSQTAPMAVKPGVKPVVAPTATAPVANANNAAGGSNLVVSGVSSAPSTPTPAATTVIPANSPFAMASITPTSPTPAAVPTQQASVGTPSATSPASAKPTAAQKLTVMSKLGWGIQVGAYSSHALAEQSLKQAQRLAPDSLRGAEEAIAGPTPNGAPVHRARLENISQLQAKKACSTLISNNLPCFIYKVGPENI